MNKLEFLALRNMVLEEFVNLETIINIIISHKYFGNINKDFVFPVLHSPQFSFALRVDILSKIVKDFNKDFKHKLLRMGNIRNIFAHISPNYFDGGGGEITFDKVGWFPNPDNPSERLDFQAIHREFFELRDKVLSYVVESGKAFGAFPDPEKEDTTRTLT